MLRNFTEKNSTISLDDVIVNYYAQITGMILPNECIPVNFQNSPTTSKVDYHMSNKLFKNIH